jgi:hypothetical protein
LADAGGQLFDQGDYATALERFQRAEEIFHAPPHLLFIARAQVKLGQLVEARDTYERLVDEQLDSGAPPPFRAAQDDGRAELEQLRGRIPSIQIAITGKRAARAVVTVDDGEPIAADALAQPVDVNPGEHVVTVTAEGHAPSSQTITVEEGTQAQTVELTLGAPRPSEEGAVGPEGAEPDEGPSIAPPLVVGGVGIAALGVGVITGVLTLNDAAELKDRCPQNPCPPEYESLADSVNTLGTVSTIAFVVGGAAVGASVLWLLVQGGGEEPEHEQAASGLHVELALGAQSLGITGTF